MATDGRMEFLNQCAPWWHLFEFYNYNNYTNTPPTIVINGSGFDIVDNFTGDLSLSQIVFVLLILSVAYYWCVGDSAPAKALKVLILLRLYLRFY